MADPFTDLLSDYLDDEDMASDDRRRIEAHLAGCGECRATLDDLREVVARAAGMEDTLPEADLWPDVAARIGAGPKRDVTPLRVLPASGRRISFTVPQLVAAGLALMLLSGGTVWLARLGGSRTDFEPLSAEVSARAASSRRRMPRIPSTTGRSRISSGRWRPGARGCRRRPSACSRPAWRPWTARSRSAARALADDPSSVYLNTHLASTQRRKLTLLRRAAALVAPQS